MISEVRRKVKHAEPGFPSDGILSCMKECRFRASAGPEADDFPGNRDRSPVQGPWSHEGGAADGARLRSFINRSAARAERERYNGYGGQRIAGLREWVCRAERIVPDLVSEQQKTSGFGTFLPDRTSRLVSVHTRCRNVARVRNMDCNKQEIRSFWF